MKRKNSWKAKYDVLHAEHDELARRSRVYLAEIKMRDLRIHIIRKMLGLDAPPILFDGVPFESDGAPNIEQVDAQLHTAILKLREPRTTPRRKLAESRTGLTRRFEIPVPDNEPLKIYVTVNTYDDRTPGEIFVRAAKVGTLAHGALDALAIVMSIALQHGVPIEAITGKLVGMRFEPSGMTGDRDYPTAHSIVDVIARWLRDKFTRPEQSE